MFPHAQVGIKVNAEVAYAGRWADEVVTDHQRSRRLLVLPTCGRTPEQIRFTGVQL